MPESAAAMAETRWHIYDCRVRWSDVDLYGHVNNVKYFEYFQEARINLLSSVAHPGHGGESMVVARLVVDYKQPIFFRAEPYVIRSRVNRRGTSSFELFSQILDPAPESGDAVFASATAALVAFDSVAGSSRPLTDAECERLDSLLAG